MTREQMIEAARLAYNGGVSRYLYNQFGALNQPDMERAGMTAAFDAIAGTLIEQGRQMERADVVAWLRARGDCWSTDDEIADAIQRGEHAGDQP